MKNTKIWKGWYFDNERLYDPEGNNYDQASIRASLYGEQLYRELAGTPSRIKSMKNELEKRIKKHKQPEIIIKTNEHEIIINLNTLKTRTR